MPRAQAALDQSEQGTALEESTGTRWSLMDRERFSAIGHEGIEFWNPVAPEVLKLWVDRLPLTPESLILDVGCGRAALLMRAVERFGCRAVGVDVSESCINDARSVAISRSIDSRLELRCEPFHEESIADSTFDFAACIGSTHAMEDLENTLRVFTRLVKPGGLVLVGDGYWKKVPDAAYLEFLGCTQADLRTHSETLDLVVEQSFEVVATHESSAKEWSQYEDAYSSNIERFVRENPDDPESPAMLQKIRAWREAYLRWGKETLGFGLYLLQVPE